jgi:hypothetical protein
LLYLVISATGIRFGHARNFFYLLPFYFLIIFHGLERLSYNKKLFYVFSSVILIFLFLSGIMPGYNNWSSLYIEREMIRYADKLGVDCVSIPRTALSARPFLYYAKKYGVVDKFYRRFGTDCRKGPCRGLAIIERNEYPSIPIKHKYRLGNKSLTINRVIYRKAHYGPFKFIQKFIQPPASIVIYFVNDYS